MTVTPPEEDRLPSLEEDEAISVPINGEPLRAIRQLKRRLKGVTTDKDVVLKAIAVLNKANGKEIQIIHDGGIPESIFLWREQ